MHIPVRVLLLPALFAAASTAAAQPPASAAGGPPPPVAGTFVSLDGGYVHQFETGVDGAGGDFSVDRIAVRGSVGYRQSYTRSVALSIGYDRDNYDFGGTAPWQGINTYRIGAPVRWGLDDRWTLFLIPSLRWQAEDGAGTGDAFSGGGFVGASYRFGPGLTIGPGIGGFSQIEDDVSVFPVLIVRWEIVEKLWLETGGGLGATQGPGLQLRYQLAPAWSLAGGARYEKFRFRLDSDGPVPDGVGEDSSTPAYVSVSYRPSRKVSIGLIAGAEFAGELKLENSGGGAIAESDYDTAPFAGLLFDLEL